MEAVSEEQCEWFWYVISECTAWALQELVRREGPLVALEFAEAVDRGDWRLMSTFQPDDEGVVDAFTLRYAVEVLWRGKWWPLFDVGRETLGVTDDQCCEEMRLTMLQHGVGIPDSPAQLFDSPPAA